MSQHSEQPGPWYPVWLAINKAVADLRLLRVSEGRHPETGLVNDLTDERQQ
jgi:hypothetical protein